MYIDTKRHTFKTDRNPRDIPSRFTLDSEAHASESEANLEKIPSGKAHIFFNESQIYFHLVFTHRKILTPQMS